MLQSPPWFPGLGYAPLLPVACAVTAGIVLDRYLDIPLPLAVLALGICLVLWILAMRQRQAARAFLSLGIGCGAIGAAYHHAWRNVYPSDDISNFAPETPVLLRLRATLAEEPVRIHFPRNDPLVSLPRGEASTCLLEVTAVEQAGIWFPTSGKVRCHLAGALPDLHNGDEIESIGWLARPEAPANPGAWDRASQLRDQRIRAEFRVRKTADGMVRLAEGWRSSLFGWLAVVRGWGQRTLQTHLPAETSGVAGALLLGDGSTMTRADWEKYIRTGVIHVLAISGQHLVVLAGFFWLLARLMGLPRRRAALLIAALLLAYALMTGGRPSAMRAAVMVAAVCGGILLRQPALPANTFALAWLIVLALQPTDLFNAGFQLSFMAVAVLIWGIPHWFPKRPVDPLKQLITENRPLLFRTSLGFLRIVGQWYLVTLVLGIALAPQVMYWQNLIAPAGFLIGPPLILLTSIALLAGFLLLFVSLFGSTIAAPFAWITNQSIAMCEWIVLQADQLPFSHLYVGQIPTWWLVGFNSIGLVLLLRPFLATATLQLSLLRSGWTWWLGLLVWAGGGFFVLTFRPDPDELRITFVAVGHGGCTVLETPDGRVLLYDAGSLAGTDSTQRHIAPFLWSRGIHRIDEVFLSHADLDHFNGLPALADRFTLGQVTVTPSFFEKRQPGVGVVAETLRQRGIPVRVTQAGAISHAGEVAITVVHPPAEGLPGPDENQRSLVLLIQYREQRVLLTGDLTGPGLQRVLGLQKTHVDVLMAPHHGSSSSNTPALLAWATPKLAIVCEEPREEPTDGEKLYLMRGIPLWSTAQHGAITLHCHRTGMVAETYKTNLRQVVRDGSRR